MKLFLLGAGGHARETYFHIKDINPKIEILFIDDVTNTTELLVRNEKVEVVKCWDKVREYAGKGFTTFTIGIGNPIHKISFVKKALDAGLSPATTWIHPSAVVQDAKIGSGGIIAPGAVVTCNIKLGDYVTINYNVSVGHDSQLGDFVSCNPGSCISGNVMISEAVLVGAGAVIKEGIKVASKVVVGAQACIVKDISNSGVVLVGVPAKIIKRN